MFCCAAFKYLCVLVVLFQLFRWMLIFLNKYLYAPYVKGTPVLKYYGKWAVVTGATDGIGKAYAEALAARKINVILISRTMEKLKSLAEEIEQRFKVETQVIQADFTNTTDIYKDIEAKLKGYDIGVLVNNVGITNTCPDTFLDLEQIDNKFQTDMINCNIFSVVNMCKIILPGMVEKRKGVIINLSSATCQIPSPMLTVYGATKAFINKFSVDLATEYKSQGIIVQSVMPGYVATKMTKIRKATWFAPAPDTYVEHALTTIGIEVSTYGYYAHGMMFAVVRFMEYICEPMTHNHILGRMKQIRKKMISKKEKN